MGGLARSIPFTWTMMLIGNLALTGVGLPVLQLGLAGFYSKDAIINAAFLSHASMGTYAFILTLTAAGMTSFYSWRQFLMTFHGRYRGQDATHGHDDHHAPALSEVHESPMVMLAPLAVLAAGAVVAGFVFRGDFIGEKSLSFWHGAIAAIAGNGLSPISENLPLWVELAPFVMTLAGFAVAFYYYILHPELPARMAAKKGLLYTFLYNKWYFDELYDFLFVQPAMKLGRFLWKFGDGTVIDGLGPDGVAARVLDATRGAVRLQSGYVYHYAFAMLIGVVALATWFMLAGGVP